MGLAARRLAALAAILTVLVAPGCAHHGQQSETTSASQAPGAPAPGAFFDASGPVSLTRAAEAAGRADYVLIGEGHPSACDHLAQAELIEAMARAGRPHAVGLEMVSLDAQPVLDRFNRGEMEPKDLEQALDWPRSWGFDFALYLPVFEAARTYHLPVHALNIPREAVRTAGRTGLAGLDPRLRRKLPRRVIPVSPEQADVLRPVFQGHHPATPPGVASMASPDKDTGRAASKAQAAAWERFQFVQALWDTTMAHRAVAVRQKTGLPVAILAGSGHVERGLGIAARLAVLDPEASRLLVMPWRGGEGPDPAQANMFFFSPDTPRRPRLGLTLEPRGDALAVAAVEPGSKAQAAGFKPGDVLTVADGAPVRQALDIHQAAMAAARQGRPLTVEVLRAGSLVVLEIPVEPAKDGR